MNFRPELLGPELFQLILIALLFAQSLSTTWKSHAGKWVPAVAGFGVLVALASMTGTDVMFYGAYKVDALSQFFKLAVAIGFFVATLNATRPSGVEEEKEADYFMFLALSAWGLQLLSSSVELITVYVALEISSYSLYALVPLRSGSKEAAEAGIKYILFGAVATAIALYGYSFILAEHQTSYLAALAMKPWSFAEAPMAVPATIPTRMYPAWAMAE